MKKLLSLLVLFVSSSALAYHCRSCAPVYVSSPCAGGCPVDATDTCPASCSATETNEYENACPDGCPAQAMQEKSVAPMAKTEPSAAQKVTPKAAVTEAAEVEVSDDMGDESALAELESTETEDADDYSDYEGNDDDYEDENNY